jgi:hypothetical protein
MKSTVLRMPAASSAAMPALAMTAPTMPPISACELLLGMPHHQVMTFQLIAPMSAPNTTWVSTMPGCTMFLPTVVATERWKTKRATKLKKAANSTAWPGLSTPVETTVAIEFAASWKPFMKSKDESELTQRGGGLAQLEDHERLGHTLDVVEDVVEVGGDFADVVAVERGDEGGVEREEDLLGDGIPGVLDGFELDRVHPAVFEGGAGGDGLEGPHGLDQVLGVLGEQFAETLLLGHQKSDKGVEFHVRTSFCGERERPGTGPGLRMSRAV